MRGDRVVGVMRGDGPVERDRLHVHGDRFEHRRDVDRVGRVNVADADGGSGDHVREPRDEELRDHPDAHGDV